MIPYAKSKIKIFCQIKERRTCLIHRQNTSARLCFTAKKGAKKVRDSYFESRTNIMSNIKRSKIYQYAIPCASIASATLRNPAMLAPATRFPSQPYSLAAEAALL